MNEQDILNKMLECNACSDITGQIVRYDYGLNKREKIDRMYELLPTVDYAKDQAVNYIFSDGIVASTLNETEILNGFLEQRNNDGTSNFSTLRECVGWAIIDGECGLRYFDGSLYIYKSGYFGIIYEVEDGITKVYGYVVSKERRLLTDINLDDYSLYDYLEQDEDLLVLSTDEFVHIRNDISFLHGQSPLLTDQLRLDLLITAYQQLLKDLKYDGPGRIIIRPRDGFAKGEENDISTGKILDSGMVSEQIRAQKAKQEAARVAEEIKNSSSDSVVVLSTGFDKEITHLERVTKATEFLEWVQDKEGPIISEVIGIEARLLGYGHQAGNVAMNKVIDNAMKNNIIPLRTAYQVQFADFIGYILNITGVRYGDHIFEEQEAFSAVQERTVDMMVKLAGIGQNELVDSLGQMLRDTLYDDNNNLKKLSVSRPKNGVLSRIKAILGGQN